MPPSHAETPSLVSRLFSCALPLGVLLCLATIVSLFGLVQLDFSDSPRDIFSRADESSRLLEEVHERFGADDTDIVVVLDSEDLLTRESLIKINEFVEALREDSQIAAVHSLFDARRAVRLRRRTAYWMIVPPDAPEDANYEEIREQLLNHPLLRDRMLSTDGRTTIVVAQMPDAAQEISEVVKVVDSVRQTAMKSFSGTSIRVRLTGQPSLRVDTFHNLKKDQLKFSICCGATLFLIGLALFRRLQPVLVALAGPGIGVLWTVGAMGWFGQRFDGINVVLPMLLFVIGFTDALHIVIAIRNARRAGASPHEAAYGAVAGLGRACFLTSLTTAIGFGSLSLSSLTSIHRFGVYAAIGAMFLYIAVITIVPLLTLCPWLREIVSPHDSLRSKVPIVLTSAVKPILRRSLFVSLLGIASVLLIGWSGRDVPFDMHWSEALPTSGETVEAIHHLDDSMGGSVLALVLVEWPQGLNYPDDEVIGFLSEVHEVLSSYSTPAQGRPTRFGQPTSILTVLEGLQAPGEPLTAGVSQLERRAPQRVDKLVNSAKRQALVTIPVPEKGALTLLPIFNSIDEEFAQLVAKNPGYSARLTGSTVVSARNLNDILMELVQSVILAAIVVFFVLCVAFRSIRFGLLSVAPNCLPLVVVVAVLGPLGVPMQVTAALTLCLGLGIAVDDTIHLISRFKREQSHSKCDQVACLRAYQAVGHVIVFTTVILVCGFSTMLLSESPAIRLFGLLSCIALAAALIGDLVILPAMLSRWSPRCEDSFQPREKQQ